ncbi:MAG: hypothetical protein PHH09_05255 [Methanoregulaceae archaeon]|jgi:hypothetical protein|nr:hypothetical protein [Methanoregulaceae archaeon]
MKIKVLLFWIRFMERDEKYLHHLHHTGRLRETPWHFQDFIAAARYYGWEQPS